MKMPACICLMFFLFVVALSCRQNGPGNGHTVSIDLENPEKTSFLSHFSRIELQKLENTRESAIGHRGKILPYQDKYLIEDRQQGKLLLFSQDGSFIRELGMKGRGPGEFGLLRDFNIRKDNGHLEILSLRPNKIIEIDLENHFIGERALPSVLRAARYFQHLEDGKRLVYSGLAENQLYLYSPETGETEPLLGEIPHYISTETLFNPNYSPFSSWEGNVSYSTVFSNDIFYYTNGVFGPAYRWDFGPFNFDIQEVLPQGLDRQFYRDFFYNNEEYAFYFYYHRLSQGKQRKYPDLFSIH